MLGEIPGKVPTQGFILSNLLAREDNTVLRTSSVTGRFRRLVDILISVYLWRNRYEVLIVEVYGGRSFVVEDAVTLLGSTLGKKILLWYHGGDLPVFFARYPRWARKVCGRGHVHVVPSEYLARCLIRVGVNARQIPNIIDERDYVHTLRTHPRASLLWMRGFHPLYAPELAVQVLAEVRKHKKDAKLIMAGQYHSHSRKVMDLARALGVSDAIEFPGFLGKAEKATAFRNADVFLNTSTTDNSPVALIEAGACGLPIVSTAVGGIPDLVKPGRDALLVEPGDGVAMAEAVLRVLNEPVLAARLSLRGAEVARRSFWGNVRGLWIDALSHAAGRSQFRCE
jgi:phenylacetate-CoA ligase